MEYFSQRSALLQLPSSNCRCFLQEEQETFSDLEQFTELDSDANATSPPDVPSLGQQPSAELPEDFIRNFLIKRNLAKTLKEFEAEWCVQTALLSRSCAGACVRAGEHIDTGST